MKKRNNLILFSFLVFAIICLLVRSFVEFETWDYVVIAVAISSAFLTYADFFAIYANAYAESYARDEKLVANITRMNNEEKEIIKSLRCKLDDLKQLGEDVSQEEHNFKGTAEYFQTVDEISEEITKEANNKRSKQKSFSFRAMLLTFLAFLSFLCIITFTGFADIINKAGDIIAVMSFVVVLSSQYVNTIFAEKNEKERLHYEQVLSSHTAAREQLFCLREKFNIYYEKVKDYAD